MSNPLRAFEFCMKTETWSWVPCVPDNTAGLDGHEVVPDETMHTTPTPTVMTVTMTVIV